MQPPAAAAVPRRMLAGAGLATHLAPRRHRECRAGPAAGLNSGSSAARRLANWTFEFVVDAPRQRIVVADNEGVTLAMQAAAPGESTLGIEAVDTHDPGQPQRMLLPIAPGRTERPQPTHIALHPATGRLCVLTLGGEELVFLDEHLAVTAPLAQRPFGGAKAPLRIPLFAFDANGERLVILDGDGQAIVWSIASGRAERRVRRHGSNVDAVSLHGERIISLGSERPLSGDARSVLRQVPLDAPRSLPIALMGSNAAKPPQGRSLESAPTGHDEAAST